LLDEYVVVHYFVCDAVVQVDVDVEVVVAYFVEGVEFVDAVPSVVLLETREDSDDRTLLDVGQNLNLVVQQGRLQLVLQFLVLLKQLAALPCKKYFLDFVVTFPAADVQYVAYEIVD